MFLFSIACVLCVVTFVIVNRQCTSSAPKGSVVMIESPYSGDIDRNVRYLQLAMADAMLNHNECPYASHIGMTMHARASKYYCSDYDEKWNLLTREQAIRLSHNIRHRCDFTVFYVDRGWSTGMKAALEYCTKNQLPYEIRSIDTYHLSKTSKQTRGKGYPPEFVNSVVLDGVYELFFMDA